MAKQVSVSMLREENKVYDEFVELPVYVDKETHTIKIYPIFKPEKIRDLVDGLFDFTRHAKKENIEFNESEFSDVIAYFILKHFTDVKFSKSKNPKVIFEEYRTVLNSKLFKEILKLIPQFSIEEVYERVFEVLESMEKVEQYQSRIKDNVSSLNLVNKNVLLPH